MNIRQKIEAALLVALIATTALLLRSNLSSQPLATAGQIADKEKLVATVVRQSEDSRLSAMLIKAPIVVWLLLLKD